MTADERNTAAVSAYPEGSLVATMVYSIGGRADKVAGTVTGHKRGMLLVRTDCHGTLAVPLDKATKCA
jgi:hypothetical protein